MIFATKLICPLTAGDVEGMLRQAAVAAAGGADLLEYRLDCLRQRPGAPELSAIVNRTPLPAIFTCRPKDQGGRFEGERKVRLEVLLGAAAAGSDYVDVEMDCLNAFWSIARGNGRGGGIDMDTLARRIIVSQHYLTGQPAGLSSILKAMEAMPSGVTKIAFAGSSPADAMAALDAVRQARRPAIVLAMGEAGVASRVLARKFGAFGTFASLDASAGTAPGQPTLADMHNLYRWNSIGPATKVYGVVGCPIGHSMSPAVHNAALAATGQDGVYLPLCVEPGEQNFRAFMKSLAASDWLDCAGLSVTIPHKENAFAYLGSGNCDEASARIGAVNTVTWQREWHGRPARESVRPGEAAEPMGETPMPHELMGETPMPHEPMGETPMPQGHNTDHSAAREALCEAMAISPDQLGGAKIAILGAGGAARAAAYGLLEYGASVTIYNRTLARGQAIARSLGCAAAGLDEISAGDASVIINCTSVGMHPKVDKSPIGAIGPLARVVFDTIYNPPQTLLLKMAAQAGCLTIGGAEMFLRQAQQQFTMFTGLPAPAGAMRDAMKARLKG